ncbi:MAG: TIGR03618 family F420-dependent PPOX class oxidoreductase [bacterium]|nr:TIGR03618 family F420-dependent PPOX class oxidoreductase [bacterium]
MVTRRRVLGTALGALVTPPFAAAADERTNARASGPAVEGRSITPAVAAFLGRPLASQLVTLNTKGDPQITMMWFRYEDGGLLFTTTTKRIKFRNQQRDPRAAFCAADPADMYRWVTVTGTLSIDGRDPRAFYRGLAERYLAPDALAAWQARVAAEGGMDDRTVLRLTPKRVRAMGLG